MTVLKLLEMQRHAMLMYTSCGWFFDELSGLETVQVMHYAGRALRLAEECSGEAIEAEFLQHLANAKSNLPEYGDGAQIYEKWVKPAVVDIERVAGHYAISLCLKAIRKTRIDCHEVERLKLGGRKGRCGWQRARRFLARRSQRNLPLDFSVLHLGDHNVTAVQRLLAIHRSDQKKLTDAFGSGRHG